MKKMKKIISILITLCLTVSLVAGLAVSSSAAAVSGEKRTLPRVRTAPVMDGVRDDLYDQGFQETLSFENAGFSTSSYATPQYEPASAKISAVWYSNLPDDADIIGIWDTADDTQGGLYIYADVTDCTKAWGVNNGTVIDRLYLEDPSSYPYARATPEFELSDSFWVLLDPVNYKSGTGKGLSGFAFTAYCGSATGNGELVYPVPSWREYFYWAKDMPRESGAGGTLSSLITVDVKSDVRFVANEKYPFPEPPAEGADNKTIVIYRSNLRKAYQYAKISGYSLEMFISWSATQMDVDDPSADVNDFLYPVVGTEFGMGFQLYDNLFDYPIGTKPAFDEVQHHIFLNCGLLDFGEGEVEYWSDAAYPIYYPRYILGDYADGEATDGENLRFSGASVTIQNNLQVNFKVSKELLDKGFENVYAIFTIDGTKTLVKDFVTDGNYYTFRCSNIRPDQINDSITATLHADYFGRHYTTQFEYSISDYCYRMLERYAGNEDYCLLRTLLVDLLNYGAASQLYTGHNTDALANASLTEEQKAEATQQVELFSVQNLKSREISDPTVTWTGAGLNLKEAIVLRFKIATESIEGLTVKVKSGSQTWEISSESFEATSGGYYVYFNGLNAAQLSDPVFLTAYQGDTAVSNTICYSVESYAYAKQKGPDSKLKDLLDAMMKYGNSAYAYTH